MQTNPKFSRAQVQVSLFSMAGAFITYCSMYAFRKPFTAGVFSDLSIWGVDYKIVLITTQVMGYMLSKFIGIKVVSEMPPQRRIQSILLLMGVAWVSLFLFGLTPYPFNFIWLFFNGLPLGMIWGLVFSFLEGRRNTELLGAGMAASFIVASGLVKSVGKYLVDNLQVDEFWMPFLAGAMFVPTLFLGVWMLHRIPPPSVTDKAHRTERVPMDGSHRKAFFREFAPGIMCFILVYIALTIFRDVRDNFAVEIWTLLGHPNTAKILLIAEIPIAIAVFSIVAAMIFIKNNHTAFFANIAIILFGGLLLIATTCLFEQKLLTPTVWMISVGFAMYLSYISYHTMLFERWLALFRQRGNIGFLMYLSDAFGYLGSVGILLYKNFGGGAINWLNFIIYISYIVGGLTVVLCILAWSYFRKKERALRKAQAL